MHVGRPVAARCRACSAAALALSSISLIAASCSFWVVVGTSSLALASSWAWKPSCGEDTHASGTRVYSCKGTCACPGVGGEGHQWCNFNRPHPRSIWKNVFWIQTQGSQSKN
eukprot:scaffold226468_cov23-Tisochrysis_lutea.AAC.1